MMDSDGIGAVNIFEIINFLREHEVNFTETELYMSIRQYDSDGDGKLSFEEFLSLVLPSTNIQLRN
jgi:Ca2+-binding EF-hand superfamily protein